jgi:hypothetical protein
MPLRVLHADHRPAAMFRFLVERLRERPDFGRGQTLGRTVGVLAGGIVTHTSMPRRAPAVRAPLAQLVQPRLEKVYGGSA